MFLRNRGENWRKPADRFENGNFRFAQSAIGEHADSGATPFSKLYAPICPNRYHYRYRSPSMWPDPLGVRPFSLGRPFRLCLTTATSGDRNRFSSATFSLRSTQTRVLEGGSPEKDFAGIQNVKKRLFEENGMLIGEIAFTFDSLAAVRLFRYDEESPIMYFAGNPLSSEQLVETDGAFGRDWMPVVFWPAGTKEFYIKTRTQSEVSYRKPLLNHYHAWLAETEKTKKRQ